jgi:zinc/manganese transport system substrate-binding protein
MRAVTAALAPVIEQETGIDLGTRPTDLAARLDELDREIAETLAAVPQDRRKLVTGHESMGYFADRYGFELEGTVIPGLTSQADVSASQLADLKEQIEHAGVSVVFTEIGTPTQVAQAVADETGATLVELPSHNLPEDGSYFTFMRGIAATIAQALTP